MASPIIRIHSLKPLFVVIPAGPKRRIPGIIVFYPQFLGIFDLLQHGVDPQAPTGILRLKNAINAGN